MLEMTSFCHSERNEVKEESILRNLKDYCARQNKKIVINTLHPLIAEKLPTNFLHLLHYANVVLK